VTCVLHVPYTYFPDAAGGTEVYVAALCAELARFGIESRVAAPARQAVHYRHEGIAVDRFATMVTPGVDQAWNAPDLEAADNFAVVLDRAKPDIVHLHARTAAVSSALVKRARQAGAKLVATYHSPTFSCPRGTMLLHGKTPCDGEVRTGRCVRCVLGKQGVAPPVAALAASPPGIALSRRATGTGRIPALIEQSGHDLRALLAEVDHLVAVCDWVRAVLLINGATPDKVTLSRQGVANGDGAAPLERVPPKRGPLRIAYYGRLDRTKGVDLIVDAMLAAPLANARLDLFLVEQAGQVASESLRRRCANDARIAIKRPIPPDAVQRSMAGYDLIAVPSSWMETGPLVVLEAQAAGVPVIGARRGGIAELVRDGDDGVLIEPDDVAAWSAAIAQFAVVRDQVARLRTGVRQPRNMADAAADMAALYDRLLSHPGGRPAPPDRKIGAAA